MLLLKKCFRSIAGICALFLSMGMVYAQDVTVTGTVTDPKGVSIVGAYVVVQGTTRGTTTNLDGFYTISAPTNGTLSFTSMGYKDVVVAVNGRAKINVIMERFRHLRIQRRKDQWVQHHRKLLHHVLSERDAELHHFSQCAQTPFVIIGLQSSGQSVEEGRLHQAGFRFSFSQQSSSLYQLRGRS